MIFYFLKIHSLDNRYFPFPLYNRCVVGDFNFIMFYNTINSVTITYIEKKLHGSIMYSYVFVTWVYNVLIITKIFFTILF